MVDHVANSVIDNGLASLKSAALRLSLHYRTDELRRSIEHLCQSPKRLWQRKCISRSNRSCDWRKKLERSTSDGKRDWRCHSGLLGDHRRLRGRRDAVAASQ